MWCECIGSVYSVCRAILNSLGWGFLPALPRIPFQLSLGRLVSDPAMPQKCYSLMISKCSWDLLVWPQTWPVKFHLSDGHLDVTRPCSCHQSSSVNLAQMELDDALSVCEGTNSACVLVIILGSRLLFTSAAALCLFFPRLLNLRFLSLCLSSFLCEDYVEDYAVLPVVQP